MPREPPVTIATLSFNSNILKSDTFALADAPGDGAPCLPRPCGEQAAKNVTRRLRRGAARRRRIQPQKRTGNELVEPTDQRLREKLASRCHAFRVGNTVD